MTKSRALDILDDIREKHFWTYRETELKNQLSFLLKESETGTLAPLPRIFSSTGEARGLVVTGPSGAGKSDALEYCFREVTQHWKQDESCRPFIKITSPSLDNAKDLAIEAANEIGYFKVSESRSRGSVWRLVRHRFTVLGTAVFWIDEAHDIFGHNNTEFILSAIKKLLAHPVHVVVVLSGVNELHEHLFANSENKRRFRHYEIPPVDPIGERELIERALATYASAVGVAYPEDPAIVDRLLHGVANRLGRCLEIMLDALHVAIKAGHQQLDMQHFAEAWSAHLECPRGANVFLVENWPDVHPVHGFDRAPSAHPAASRRPKRRK